MELVNFLWQYGGVIEATLVCGWCMASGGRTERFAAAVVLLAWYMSIALQSHAATGPGPWVELIDFVVLLIFSGMSLITRKIWTIFAAALQLDTVVGHVAAKVAHFGQYPYAVALGLWGGDFMLVVLAVGVISYRRTKKRRQMADAKSTY